MLAYRLLATALFLSSTALACEAAPAADFRVENSVFIEGQSQPQSQGVTIFHQGLVYDFLNDPAEVIVFDPAHRRFILLDTGRRVRSEISADDVQAVVNRVKQRLAGQPNPTSRWLVDPSFEESFDRENSELTLKGDPVTYRARLQATDAAMAAQYHEFSDCYTQLNLALNPSSRPPFPRMLLNEAIERRQGIAKEVHLVAALAPGDPPLKVVSRHQLAAALGATDRNRVAEVRRYAESFTAVSLREYLRRK